MDIKLTEEDEDSISLTDSEDEESHPAHSLVAMKKDTYTPQTVKEDNTQQALCHIEFKKTSLGSANELKGNRFALLTEASQTQQFFQPAVSH